MWTPAKDPNSVLVVVPAYNEAQNVARAVGRLAAETKFDFVVVDDGSTDATAAICAQNFFKAISHPENMGLSAAMRTGFEYARRHGYRYVAQYDGDGQHNPGDVARLVERIKAEGLDLVLGTRFLGQKTFKNPLKRLARRIFIFLFWRKTKVRITDPTNGLRVYGRKFVDLYCANPNYEVEPATIAYAVSRHGLRFAECPVTVNERRHGHSKFDSKWETAKYVKKQILLFVAARSRWE